MKALIGGVLVAGVLAATAPWWGEAYCGALLPLVEEVLRVGVPGWQSVTAHLLTADGQGVVLARFASAAGFDYRGVAVPPGTWVEARTLQGYWLQHPVLVIGVWAAWPQPTAAARLGAAALLPVALLALAVTDLPLTLYGALTDTMLAATGSGQPESSWAVQAMQVLDGGGRGVLGLVAGAAVAAGGGVLARRGAVPAPDDGP